MTTPFGQLEKSFDIVDMALASGANFVARTTAFHAQLTDEVIGQALANPGFNLIEFFSPCHTQYGRKNKYKNAIAMYQDLKSKTMDVDKYKALEESKREGVMPIGVFLKRDDPALETRYAGVRAKLQEAKQKKAEAAKAAQAKPAKAKEPKPDKGAKGKETKQDKGDKA